MAEIQDYPDVGVLFPNPLILYIRRGLLYCFPVVPSSMIVAWLNGSSEPAERRTLSRSAGITQPFAVILDGKTDWGHVDIFSRRLDAGLLFN
jgi:hypothetical protein